MIWIILNLIAVGALALLLWRFHGNRQATKDLGSDARRDPGDAIATVTHYRSRAEHPREASDAEPLGASPRVGTISAWRSWRLDGSLDDQIPPALIVRLMSTSREELWEGPVKLADCAPSAENTNGIYAAKTWNDYIVPGTSDNGDARVFGRLGLYGIVIEAERGYRAEKAIIEELWLVDLTTALGLAWHQVRQLTVAPAIICQCLAARYQVEVHEGWPDGQERSSFQARW